MRVSVNGEQRELADGSTVADVVGTAVGDANGARGIAVAVDGEVVRRGHWPEVVVADGAEVEILTAVQGG